LFCSGETHVAEVKDNLRVKETLVNGNRYLVCYNPYQTKNDRLTREAAVKQPEQDIKDLDPSMKKAVELYSHDYKGRFLRRLKGGSLRNDRARVREDEKHAGKYVLPTSEEAFPKD